MQNLNDDSTSLGLIQRVKQPESGEAWTEFVDQYRPLILTICRQLGLQACDAEDATQRVLICLVTKIKQFRYRTPTDRFRHWLKAVTRNAVIDTMRSIIRHRHVTGGPPQVADLLMQIPAYVDSSVEEAACQLWELAEVERQVRRRVSEKTWAAYVARKRRGESGRDIADRLDMTPEAVFAAAARVLRLIRAEVQKKAD